MSNDLFPLILIIPIGAFFKAVDIATIVSSFKSKS
jgi:hypothetical protein